MKKILVFSTMILLSLSIFADNNSCKVLLKNIDGKYNGQCKDGLASGQGIAMGVDTYVGNFLKGLPDGKGVYTYKNGDVYKGHWTQGQKNGRGVFIYTLPGTQITQIVKGYWKDNQYVGKSLDTDSVKPYNVTSTFGIMDYSVKRTDSLNTKITISIKDLMVNYIPIDLSIDASNGQVIPFGNQFMIINYACPMTIDISYSVLLPNNVRRLCRFSVILTESGSYNISLSNN